MNEVNEQALIDLPAGLSLGDSEALSHRPLSLIDQLNPTDRERVRAHGTERMFERGEVLFRQNDPHDGIVIVEEGLERSFYTAPSGREITLA
jgi:CRP/FNR family transcriptional regulator, cyclic AMP receptor protein